MKVLVTGSSGWLCRYLIPLLRQSGHETLGLDIVAAPLTDVTGSVVDQRLVQTLFRRHRFDAVVHTAALHKPDIVRYSRQSFIDVNISGTANLLEVANERPGTRFVFTSTTSLMISQQIRDEQSSQAVWLDEDSSPVAPRNIYGVSKLAAEGLCRMNHLEQRLGTVVLRTSRFFPEEDDSITSLAGPNLKTNELLHRRATVHDMARAHLVALEKANEVGFGLYIVSAPTPFGRDELRGIKNNASAVIERHYPSAASIYTRQGWQLPQSIGRIYDGSRITRELGFEYATEFGTALDELAAGRASPVEHIADYVSPAWVGKAAVGSSGHSLESTARERS